MKVGAGLLLAFGLTFGSTGCESAPTPAESPTAPPRPSVAAGAARRAPAEQEPDCFVIVDADPDSGEPPLTVRFESDADCSKEPITYSWDFGDGKKGGNEADPTHVYENEGDFVAVVRVTSPDGGESDDEIDITVDPMLAE